MVSYILKKIRAKAINSGLSIIYTEGEDDRILSAARVIYRQNIAKPIIVGDKDKILFRMKKLKINPEYFKIIDPLKSDKLVEYANDLYIIQKEKKITKETALELMKQSNYFGTMMLKKGEADCLISGASYTTAETLHPALQIIKTILGVKVASSFFMMVLKEKVYFFADCGFVRYPNAEELSEIAISTADSARKFGLQPRIAMLSYSTKGSGFGNSIDNVRKATQIVIKKRPDLLIDGELQLDSAIVPEIARLKCPNSPLKGKANVLIFPDLNSGNIGYKLVERLAKAEALGPIVQGLNKHVNVLSRGCSVRDIIEISTISVMRALDHEKDKKHFKSEKHLLSKK